MGSFALAGLDHSQFAHLFHLSEAELRDLGAVRRVATENPGFPCRVSLEDAEVGEELLLRPHLHQPAASPYRASGPIFVRRGAVQRTLPPGEVPQYVTRRVISVRAYDQADMMVAANVVEGLRVADELSALFRRVDVAYVHLHNAKQGCFSCSVKRAL